MALSGSIIPSLQRQSRLAFSPTIRTSAASSRIALLQRHLSSGDGSNLVSGVTPELMKQDPVVDDFIRSNYPEVFKNTSIDSNKPITNWGERRRQIPKPPLNIRPMETLKRDPDTEEGTNRCFPMRRHGFIPGLIFGGDPTKGISGGDPSTRIFVKTRSSLLQSEIDRYKHSFGSRVYDLTLYDNEEAMEAGDGGILHRVMPQSINVHPVNDTVYCCNFLRYYPGRPIKLPLLMINEEESPALKRDGFLIPINRFVECIIDEGVDIPEELEVECTGLQFKQVIRLDRVIFPEGVRPSKKVLKHKDFMIGPIHGGKSGADDDDTAAAAEAAE